MIQPFAQHTLRFYSAEPPSFSRRPRVRSPVRVKHSRQIHDNSSRYYSYNVDRNQVRYDRRPVWRIDNCSIRYPAGRRTLFAQVLRLGCRDRIRCNGAPTAVRQDLSKDCGASNAAEQSFIFLTLQSRSQPLSADNSPTSSTTSTIHITHSLLGEYHWVFDGTLEVGPPATHQTK